MLPTESEARSFALMLWAGMPPEEALLYFLPEGEEQIEWARKVLPKWLRSRAVKTELLAIQGGKEWTALSLDEKVKLAIDKHYTEMAYFLYSHNYSTLSPQDAKRADVCRLALEAKLAGTAGAKDPLSAFFDDIKSGRVKLTQPLNQPPSSAVPSSVRPS